MALLDGVVALGSTLAAPRPVPVPNPRPATPFVTVDLGRVAALYDRLAEALPGVGLYYAVKANPAPAVLGTLAAYGARWDVASPGEIDAVLRADADPGHLSYGNPVKKAADIRHAHARGVRRFAVDSEEELDKLVRHAQGATLLVRLATSGAGADWSLSGKFGCEEREAGRLLARAVGSGHPVGVCFHVGSQQRDVRAWEAPLTATARLRRLVRALGRDLEVVDIGGGFPAELDGGPLPSLSAYGAAIRSALRRFLGPDLPEIAAEPGRALVADAGVLESEVVLVTHRAGARWVYLDVGLFSGLAETMDEAVRYRLTALRDGLPLAGQVGEVVLAGPTCDSADVLYRHRRPVLPLGLAPGDRVLLHGAGAYTTTYSSVGFNGFAPLREVHR